MLRERHDEEAVYIVSSSDQLSRIRSSTIQIALEPISEDLESKKFSGGEGACPHSPLGGVLLLTLP